MRQLRVALGQYNATVGDLSGNANQVVRAAQEAHRLGAHLLVMPEMFLTGYPIEDLALRSSFIDAAEHRLETLARTLKRRDLGHLTVIVGTLGPRTTRDLPQNIAAILHDGRVHATYAKQHLPNYGVFDEYRYFAPGSRDLLLEVHGVTLALAICEDLWSDDGPAARAAAQGADALVVINGSPYEVNKDDVRRDLCAQRARQANCPLLYANLVGGQDELVFDGDSLAVNADGSVIARAQRFGEEILLVDLSLPDTSAAADRTTGDVELVALSAEPVEPYEPLASAIAPTLSEEEELYAAIVMGLGDYVRKNGFETVILGLSGGIDSALTATVAVDALGADRVFGVSMPSKYSSEHSVRDAHDLAEALGMYFLSVPIEPMVSAFHDSIVIDGVAAENLQARVRGTTLMALSNQEGHLVLATGNKSELAVGYSTIYGDAVGGFAPLKDIAKTDVWRLAVWRNMVAEGLGETPPIPESSITKPPSAELRPDQLDTDSLPEYALLDEVLADYIEGAQGAAELVREGFDLATVERVLAMVDHAEYKRRQYPPGTKVSPRAFGRDRRLPITSRWRERATGNSSAMPPASGEGASTPEESA